MGEAFSFEGAISHGLLPVVVGAEDPDFQLRSYSGLYLKDEVQAEELVKNIGAVARFMEVMSFSHGGVLNLANAACECAVKRSTLQGLVAQHLRAWCDYSQGGHAFYYW